MGIRLIPGKNDLATVNPVLASQWDNETNIDIKPTMISAGSSMKVGWICDKGHRWLATVASRNAGAGCPICARKTNTTNLKNSLLQKNGSLATRNPELAAEWHPTKNGDMSPETVTPNTHQIVWWLGKCGHEWTASVKERNNGHGCPYCKGKKVLHGVNDLATCRPELTKEWHPTKNVDISPSEVSFGSSKIVWWKCSKCGYEWQATLKSRSKGNGCPFCSGRTIIPGGNDLAARFPQIAKEWHPTKNGNLTPYSIAPGSHTKVWWQCVNGHEWQASPNHRTSKTRNCPYCCANPKVLTGTNDLASKYPNLAKEWHPTKNGSLTPDNVTAYSSKRVWWKCPKGHEWRTAVNHRANGSQCPICSGGMQSSFPEQAIFFYVKKAYPDAINGYTEIFHNHGMELDIYIPSLSIGIEYDGSAWHNGTNHLARESRKYQVCKENAITLIRIRENKNPDTSTCDALLFVRDNLNGTISELAQFLPLLSDIDVERDKNQIKSSFLQVLSEGSLSSLYPDLAKEWHPTKNGDLTPKMFLAKSNQKVWWKCQLGHEWQATIDARTRGTRCPYCSNNKILSGFNDLASKRPDLMKEWNWEKNASLDPTQIAPGSGKKAFWICANGHEWQAEISSRNKGHGCPYCAGNR